MVRFALTTAMAALVFPLMAAAAPVAHPLTVLPSERVFATDPVTGARLEYISTSRENDNNLYFHQRSFLPDCSMAIFTRNGGHMGYLCATGELVKIQTPAGGVSQVSAARRKQSIYATRGHDVLEIGFSIRVSQNPASAPSSVTCTERRITTLAPGIAPNTSLSESANGRFLAFGASVDDQPAIVTVDVRSGLTTVVARPTPGDYAGHVQCSTATSRYISYAGNKSRLMVVDLRDHVTRAVYAERPGELVTHESWWVGDQLVFCGGHRKGEAHVKALNVATGQVRVVGPGAWWPGGSASDLARVNWWHSCADDTGRYVVTDNWHGNIVAFDARTTREVPITLGHRKYGGAGFGQGDHPHVGWEPSGRRVIFTSTIHGNPDVCIATIPE